jgi:hypothetical protein
MVIKCSYAKAVWHRIAIWFSIQVPPLAARTVRAWWRSLLRQGADDRTNHRQVIVYTIWNIWKERCR